MTKNTLVLTGSLARAARALVGVSAGVAARAAGLTRDELRDFEKHRTGLDAEKSTALQGALEGFGAVFLPDGHKGRGHGVRLKFSDEKTQRVQAWEDEGGRPAEDDV